MTDRMTKMLLVLIAVALWGLLLRPLMTPLPAVAQGKRVQYKVETVGGNSPTSGYTNVNAAMLEKHLNTRAAQGWTMEYYSFDGTSAFFILRK
jgi:hypothetical protein